MHTTRYGMVTAFVGAFAAFLCTESPGEVFVVKDGQPQAQIIIAEAPARSVRLAAQELQTTIEKISGARLSIATQPDGKTPVQLYVGRSAHTDRLKVSAEGLREGAYRIASGADWMAFIGDDTDFVPIEPWARSNADIADGKLQKEWEKIAGGIWGVPNAGMYKHRMKLPAETGRPGGLPPPEKGQTLDVWGFDERGSYNAVCGWLHRLGARWYMPGEIGEVLPVLKTIPLQRIDETVRPDFPLRRFNFRFGTAGRDTAMWSMRLGLRDPNGIQVAHGLATMTSRPEVYAAHPDWFALYGGQRLYRSDSSKNQLCYSNDELFRETVRYVRAQFDLYKYDAVSVMPPDGYTAICQCKLCAGKDTPERDDRGRLSDYVWDFVNRVAVEVRKTHPDRKVLNCAYGVYTLPPLKIDKLEPNVLVCIVGGRRPVNNKPAQQEEFRKLREGWVAKTDNPIFIFENYPFTDRGWYLPAFTPHSLGESVNATKGMSQGEDIWLSVRQDFDKVGIAFNHFLVHFTARMYGGGKGQDVDAIFREYCRLFYGPAEREMLAFFTYCEANWQEMEKDAARVDAALALFAAAQAKADAGSVYGRRLALMDDFLKGLRNKRAQLVQKRGPLPSLRLVGQARGKIAIDGNLDEEAWVECPAASTGRLLNLSTGRPPVFGTTFKSAWIGNDLYFGIRCDERPGEKPNIAATRKGDQATWYGDVVEIILDTDSHSYYQIVVNPSGAVVNVDRGAARSAWFAWDSQAEVATRVADDHWTVEVRIPVTQDENDPLNRVIGRKPTQSLPWHFNICRQRIRANGMECSAFSPTGTDNFHSVMKFAYFYDGRAHQFEADPTVTDYVIAARAAGELAQERKTEEAIAAYLALVEGKISDLQKSDALEQAAGLARAARSFERADELAGRIPIVAVRKTVLMQNLLAQRKADEVIAQYGAEDIAAWPFWKAGEAWYARGRACAAAGQGDRAESDLKSALEFTGDGRARQGIWLALSENRERTLKDDVGALAAYRSALESTKQIGGSDAFTAVLGAARILSRAGRFDEAVAVLRRAESENLAGHWRGAVFLALGDAQAAAGRKDEAIAAFKSVLADTTVDARQRQTAEQRLKELQAKGR